MAATMGSQPESEMTAGSEMITSGSGTDNKPENDLDPNLLTSEEKKKTPHPRAEMTDPVRRRRIHPPGNRRGVRR